MNVAVIQSTLKTWLETVSGDHAVVENEPRPALIRRLGFWIISPPNAIRQMGEDYPTYVDGVETVIGRRQFTCSIRYICRDQNPLRNARYWLEQIRMSLKRTLILEHFRTYGIGIVTLGPTVSYDAPHDGRMESIAAAELTLACAVTDTLGAEDIGIIETIEIASDFQDTGPDFADSITEDSVTPIPPDGDLELDGECLTLD